jgi:multidrug efflux pump subunit AcrA (membrane-fusion protein)
MAPIRFALLIALLLSACDRAATEVTSGRSEPSTETSTEEDGVKYREGKGLEVSEATRRILNITLATVEEGKISASRSRTGHVYDYGLESGIVPVSVGGSQPVVRVSLKVPAQEAKGIAVGTPVKIGEDGAKGTVTDLKVFSLGLASDAEVLVEFKDPTREYRVGQPVRVTVRGQDSQAAALIPRQALLETVSGTFVYVPNGKYFFRTPVKVGRKAEERVEILDGLYAGDEVVEEPVISLWLAELQAIRGGVACSDGH